MLDSNAGGKRDEIHLPQLGRYRICPFGTEVCIAGEKAIQIKHEIGCYSLNNLLSYVVVTNHCCIRKTDGSSTIGAGITALYFSLAYVLFPVFHFDNQNT